MVAQAELYATLAEALDEPPAWLTYAGRDWPLFEAAVHVARDEGSRAAHRAVEALSTIQPESLDARRRRYRRLFTGPGRPRLWLYESLYLDGRLLGPISFAVQQVYCAAGLAVEGAELSDHASVELAFLAWLAERGAAQSDHAADWQQLIHRFIERHAGRWLPDLGCALAASGDPVYAPIGQLLSEWLAEGISSSVSLSPEPRLPAIHQTEACTLCGFCAQVCPTQALVVRETATETGLVLAPAGCVGCGKCEQVCGFGALHLETQPLANGERVILRTSARAICPGCGHPTVSRAEVKAIADATGDWPRWLDYCLECRPTLTEKL